MIGHQTVPEHPHSGSVEVLAQQMQIGFPIASSAKGASRTAGKDQAKTRVALRFARLLKSVEEIAAVHTALSDVMRHAGQHTSRISRHRNYSAAPLSTFH